MTPLKNVDRLVQADILEKATDWELDSATYLAADWPETVHAPHLHIRPWSPLPASAAFSEVADGDGGLIIDAHGSRGRPSVLGDVLDLGGLAELAPNSGWGRPSLAYDMVVLGSCWAMPGAAGPLESSIATMLEKSVVLVGSADTVPFSAGAPVYRAVLEAYDRWLTASPSSTEGLSGLIAGVVPDGWLAKVLQPSVT